MHRMQRFARRIARRRRLLIETRSVELPADFTAAIMAEVEALPKPVAHEPPVLAWLVSFIVAAWCLVAAAWLITPAAMLALAVGALDVARTVLFAFGGVGQVIAHIGSRSNPNSWTLAAGSIAVADVLVIAVLATAVRMLQPRICGALTLVIARLRIMLGFAFVVLAFAAMHPLAADAHISVHDRFTLLHDVTVAPDEVVYGNVTVIGGNARIAGTVHGDVNTILGRCVVLDGAVIDGESHCVSGDVPAMIAPWISNAVPFGSFGLQDKHVLFTLRANAIVLLVFLLFPVRMRLALDRVERHPGTAALAGVAAGIAVIPIGALLFCSIVGIPLIILEVAALFVGIWLGTGAIALLVGRRLSELVMPSITPSPLWALILGLVVVSAAETVPLVGWPVTILVWLVGLGASILAFVRTASVGVVRGTAIGGPPMPTRPM